MDSADTPDELPGLYEGLVSTRAIRRYRDDDIPDADLNRMLFAATRAPSGHNRQPFRFLVVRRTPEMAKVRRLLTTAYQRAWADSRSEPPPEDDSPKARIARTMAHFVDHIGEAPVIVFGCLRGREQPTGLFDGASIYPACQNLLLAARSLGYGGVMSHWHRSVADELARRLPLGNLVFQDRWGNPATWAADPPGTRYTGG